MTELVMKLPALWLQGLGGLRSVYGLILLIPTAVLILDPAELWPILTTAGEALLGTLPYILAAVLLFAYLIELSQLAGLMNRLGLQDSGMAHLILGSTFQIEDLVAYTLGILTVIIAEGIRNKPIR